MRSDAPVQVARLSLPSKILPRDPALTLLLWLIIGTSLVFVLAMPSQFLAPNTLRSMAFQLPELGILSLAMMVALLSGGLNLAIVATANLSGLVIAGIVTSQLTASSPVPMVCLVLAEAFIAGFIASLLIGLLNGLIVAFLGVHPILVTLGSMTLVNGIAVAATRGGPIGGFPDALLFVGNGTVLGVPVPMILFAGCALVTAILISQTPFGIAVRMIGSNERATRYSGVNTHWILVGVYVYSSLLCTVAAIVMMARFNSARAGYAESYLLITILAAVLGGVDPFGGFGRVLGLCLSLLLLQIISTGFNLLSLSPYLTQAIWGGVLIFALFLGLVRERWIGRRRTGD